MVRIDVEMKKKSLELKAVLDSDLDKMLDELGLLQSMEAGEISCANCGRQITRDNFYCLYVEGGEIKLCCSEMACYEEVAKRQLG